MFGFSLFAMSIIFVIFVLLDLLLDLFHHLHRLFNSCWRMSFVGYKITKKSCITFGYIEKLPFDGLLLWFFCANDVFVSLLLCSKWDVNTILIRALSRTRSTLYKLAQSWLFCQIVLSYKMTSLPPLARPFVLCLWNLSCFPNFSR